MLLVGTLVGEGAAITGEVKRERLEELPCEDDGSRPPGISRISCSMEIDLAYGR